MKSVGLWDYNKWGWSRSFDRRVTVWKKATLPMRTHLFTVDSNQVFFYDFKAFEIKNIQWIIPKEIIIISYCWMFLYALFFFFNNTLRPRSTKIQWNHYKAFWLLKCTYNFVFINLKKNYNYLLHMCNIFMD